ncbi:hypothetical protein [Aporhodopirellula aestuarii]|uniref:Uncharacterized protein n=1 Tax=Aporhodopirellula aestuarii TaxID=2950107 RepID=A0ABT0UDA3_9BACT|nr:hypothetical protein [Aporhodopirellula aestuarii]MCM2375022.1 hypothetical protein [Aporhodopirellula aestuarii]
MFRSIVFFAAVSLIATIIPIRASAEPLDADHVPADAKWVVHVDFESLSDSELADAIRQQKPQMIQHVRKWIEKRYGINPPEDLRSITAFSRDYQVHTGTVILQAEYDQAKVETVLNKAMNHRTTVWEGNTLHTVTLSKQKPSEDGPSGDEEMTVVMLDDDTIVFGSSIQNAKDAIGVLQSETAVLAGSESPLITSAAQSAWVYGAAIDLQQLENHPVAMPILSQHKQIVWALGERDGLIYEQCDLVAISEQVAQHTKTVLDGLVAYETLWAKDSDSMKDIMKSVSVNQEGNRSGFHWQGDSEKAVAALDEILRRLSTWKPLLTSNHGNSRVKTR